MKIGYARVSTKEQNLDLQLDALWQQGCSKIHREKVSGVSKRRPHLDKAMASLRPGDVLVVWKLDRLGRSLPELIDILQTLGKRGVEFQSITDGIDTTTLGGRLVYHVVAAVADFERELISERTREGMRAARCRGVKLGRPRRGEVRLKTKRRICRGTTEPVPYFGTEINDQFLHGSRIGYARVSTKDQNLDLQRNALVRQGCIHVFEEKISGLRQRRPVLDGAIEQLKAGDTLVVWKLDRLGRSLQHLIAVLSSLDARGIGFHSISDGINSTTPSGKLVFHILGAIAEFEASLISTRTKSGMQAARRRVFGWGGRLA